MAKKDLSILTDVANGKAYWSSRMRELTGRAQRALLAGELDEAADLCRRARIAQRSLQRWERVEQRAIDAGHVAPSTSPAEDPS